LRRLLRRPNPPPIPGLTLGDRRKLKQPCSLAGHRLIVSGTNVSRYAWPCCSEKQMAPFLPSRCSTLPVLQRAIPTFQAAQSKLSKLPLRFLNVPAIPPLVPSHSLRADGDFSFSKMGSICYSRAASQTDRFAFGDTQSFKRVNTYDMVCTHDAKQASEQWPLQHIHASFVKRSASSPRLQCTSLCGGTLACGSEFRPPASLLQLMPA